MNALELIREANLAGVRLELSDSGNIRAVGDEDAVSFLIPQLREHKAEIVATLQGQQAHALHLAKLAIARAALTEEQKASRLADLKDEPGIAIFWAQIYRDDEQKNGEKNAN